MPEPENIQIGSTQRFYPSKTKWVFVTLLGLIFVAAGIFIIIQKGDTVGWVVTGFFGLVVLVGIAPLLGIGSWLEVRADSFTMCSLGRQHDIRWDECSEFGVGVIGHNKTVMFNRERDMNSAAGKFARSMTGATGALPDTYGMKADALAALMNAYRAQALSGSAT